MNANEITPKANSRLNRIKIISRIVRYVTFASLLYSICCFLLFVSWLPSLASKDDLWPVLLVVIIQIVLWIWYWKLAQLFHFYDQGLIFAAKTIHCIKILGVLCVISWLLGSIFYLLPKPTSGQGLPPGVRITSAYFNALTHAVNQAHHLESFSLDFGTGINFGLLLIGIIIVLIAWIMDEGRKIQEEQLTV